MGVPLLYDASRLCTRVLNPTPNGIDRLDALLCRGLLADPDASTLVFGWRGPRLLAAQEGLAALERAERMWGEHDRAHAGHAALPAIIDWLQDTGPGPSRRVVEARRGRLGAAFGALRRLGLRRGADPVRHAPRNAICLNATHFPLDWPSHVAWLDQRADVRLVALIHDMLPLDHPTLFWSGEARRHEARLALLARRGAGATVTTQAVADRLRAWLHRAGRPELPILTAQPPVSEIFHTASAPGSRLATVPYFVACGTIEPRKNHRLLLRLWRRFAMEKSTPAPRLVIIGKRGWLCDDIIAQIGDPALARHVIEVTSLTSGDYKLLLENARALLAPSLAEGFGLPVAEALATGTPVIASDIPPFREQKTSAVTLIDPQADDLWFNAIRALAEAPPQAGERIRHLAATPEGYLKQVNGFLATLA